MLEKATRPGPSAGDLVCSKKYDVIEAARIAQQNSTVRQPYRLRNWARVSNPPDCAAPGLRLQRRRRDDPTQYGSNYRASERGGKPPAGRLRSTVRNYAQTSALSWRPTCTSPFLPPRERTPLLSHWQARSLGSRHWSPSALAASQGRPCRLTQGTEPDLSGDGARDAGPIRLPDLPGIGGSIGSPSPSPI